jgi:hypothetical protein
MAPRQQGSILLWVDLPDVLQESTPPAGMRAMRRLRVPFS